MEEEQKVEPLRDSLQAEKEETKWKKVTIIFCVVAICSTILLVTFMVLYFTKGSDNNSEGSNSSDSDDGSNPEPDVNPEDKWDWKPAGDRLKTRWGINLDPKKIWQEYPRPQLERKDWINLNGPWKYSIRNQGDIDPDEHDGYILVPFPLESSLSGVMKSLTPEQVIYYEKTVTIPEDWDGKLFY